MERQSYYRFIWSSTVAQKYIREFYSLMPNPLRPPGILLPAIHSSQKSCVGRQNGQNCIFPTFPSVT
jgi:hypothetical protein